MPCFKTFREIHPWSIISNLSHCTKEQALSHKHLVVFFLNDGPDIKLFILVGLGPELFCLLLGPPGFNGCFLLLQCFSGVVLHARDLQVSVAIRFCRVLIFVSS